MDERNTSGEDEGSGHVARIIRPFVAWRGVAGTDGDEIPSGGFTGPPFGPPCVSRAREKWRERRVKARETRR